MSNPVGVVTALIHRVQSGDTAAWDQLSTQVYPELHRIAEAHFRKERPGNLLQPTALIHETWIKLLALQSVRFEDRLHFFSLCSRFMRRILVDDARRRAAHERTLEMCPGFNAAEVDTDVLELDRALRKLEEIHPRPARVVELRYFGGMPIEEIADVLNVAPATVKRDWVAARAWLYGQLAGTPA